ncbi:MAG: beta-lactamase family protein [Anaerolineales bacterium]|nr:beta-lactamase family protein [Anaerolineales bacterium]
MKWQLTFLVVVTTLLSCQESAKKENLERTDQNGKTLEYGNPQDVGISMTQLERAVDIFKRAVDENRVTGVQLLVARLGRVVIHEAFGLRDLENGLPMEKNTLVRLASNTKTVIATGALILSDDGRLDLEDPVSKYLPGFDKGLSSHIRTKHLLSHTPGFDYTYHNFVGEVTVSSQEFPDAPSLRVEAIKIGREGPKGEPGTTFQYNNFGYTVLGGLIEEVSGQKVDAFLEQRIYAPLEMGETSHKLYGIDSTRVSTNYLKNGDKWEVLPPETPPFVRSTGGLVTTVWDFAKFCQMFLNGGSYGGKRILSRKMLKTATSPLVQAKYQYVPPDLMQSLRMGRDWYLERDNRDMGIDIAYGYGWVISKDGSYNHAGFRGTFAYVNPNLNLIILIFAQSREGGNPGQEYIEAVEAAVVE